jgi:hypothetical protein
MGAARCFLHLPRAYFIATATLILLAACSDSTSPPAAGLIFSVSPIGSKSAGSLLGAVTVSVVDADGDVVTSAANAITLDLANNAAGGTLSGTLTMNAVNGVATFTDLRINRTAPEYRLSASSPGLTSATSTGFSITNGLDAALVFTVQPVTGIANVQIPPFTVEVQDEFGNRSTQTGRAVTVVLASNTTGANLTGNVVRAVVNGSAIFSGLAIDKPGRYTINASSQNLPTRSSQAFDMTVGPATQIEFTRTPAIAGIGQTFDPSVTVGVFDVAHNAVVSGSYVINLALAPTQSSGTLSGTTTATSSGGIAVFPGLSISAFGADYRLIATSPTIGASVSSEPIVIRNQIVLSSVSSGYFHSCGRAVDAKVYCWGDNGSGQLGVSGVRRPIALPIESPLIFSTVSAGRSHSCGLIADGTAYCWGENGSGQSGPTGGSVPGRVSDVVKFAAVHAGYSHTCGLDAAGKAYCWGDNSSGELGAGVASGSFVGVSGGIVFANITAGRSFSCGAATNGSAYCWGDNSSGELGDGTLTSRSVPTPVSGGLTFRFVQAGGFHSCGLATDGKAWCWGQNSSGQLGNGVLVNSNIPVAVSGSLAFVSLTVGNRHNCGITAGGQAYCWGDNSTGALGTSTGSASVPVPVPVSGGISFSSVSAGRFHTCGVATTATYCWGLSGVFLGTGKDNGSGLPEVVR